MATQAHCAFCFETLDAHFQHRQALSLAQVEELWDQYHASKANDNHTEDLSSTAKPAAITRLLRSGDRSSASSSTSSLPSQPSSSSVSPAETTGTTPASSEVSLAVESKINRHGKYPLFVTWNKHSGISKSLRGCIGTFQAQELEHGLSTYALTSALDDHRFSPIAARLLPQLSNHVTLLTDFTQPQSDPFAWTLGTHGIRISCEYQDGRRWDSTYLPDVAKEQGWTKEETLISLMKKAGWSGKSSTWRKVWEEGRGELSTYEGKQIGLEYAEWRQWRDWADQQHVKPDGIKP